MAHRPPNLLLILVDQWRADWLGCAGQVPVRTPAIDALAARGVRFRRAYTNAPLCAPSRAALASGCRPQRVGVFDNKDNLPLGHDTYFRRLRDAGYRVGSCGKADLHKAILDCGPDGWTPRMGSYGFTEAIDSAGKWSAVKDCLPDPVEPYARYLAEQGVLETHLADYARRREHLPKRAAWPTPLAREHYTDDFVGRGAVGMLTRFPQAAPWFLQVCFASPHDPQDAPAELLDRWADADLPQPSDAGEAMTPTEHLAARRSYAAMCEGLDEWVGHLVAAVEQRGELDETVVVFASDHGEMLGDHGRWGKQVFYEPAVNIPLIAAGPGVAGHGEVSDALVELIDLSATFLDLAGLEPPNTWDARSLAPLLRGETDDHRDVAVSMLAGHRALIGPRYKLIVRDGQLPKLYDRQTDPLELENLAAGHLELLLPMAERLGAELGAVGPG